jgi:dihydroorotase-like cyclic amidohydrolase
MALQVIKYVGLRIVQGSLEFGKDADIVIWDPEASFILDSNYPIFHKHKVCS